MTRPKPTTKYRMILDGKPHWMSLMEAGVAYDSGMMKVEIGGTALDEGSSAERPITLKERRQIEMFGEECPK